ncbi:MAG TPA: hypothetical protein VFZ78_03050 [Flavisolibacter sp.]
MRIVLLVLLVTSMHAAFAQQPPSPCRTMAEYRQFDFWIGEWDVFRKNGMKAGDSRIELILDSCVILENWAGSNGVYSGKSFNTFNGVTKQWQQTWVDNQGGTIEFLEGGFAGNRMQFMSRPFPMTGDTVGIRRLSFHLLSADIVRQHGEISKDNGVTWSTEYDLEYRRKRK